MRKIKITIAGFALAVTLAAVNGLNVNGLSLHHNVNGLAQHAQTTSHR